MIGILDYGMGNLRSVQKAIAYLGGSAAVTAEEDTLDGCDKLILPGVGSFGAGIKELNDKGLAAYVKRRAAEGTPLLGICLGMQFLLEESEEEGLFSGLGLVKGRVVPFTEGKIPHMGWNAVTDMRGQLFKGIPYGVLPHVRLCGGKGQRVRRSVPSRKERGGGPTAFKEFSRFVRSP